MALNKYSGVCLWFWTLWKPFHQRCKIANATTLDKPVLSKSLLDKDKIELLILFISLYDSLVDKLVGFNTEMSRFNLAAHFGQ
jgi:hypothetical protein